jgi:hypothetical protein
MSTFPRIDGVFTPSPAHYRQVNSDPSAVPVLESPTRWY